DRDSFAGAVFLRRPDRPALVHQRAKTSESVEDCQPLDTRLYLVNEENSKCRNNGGGRRRAARTRRVCDHQQPLRLSRWDCSRKPFSSGLCLQERSEELAGGWSVDDTLRHRFYQSAKKGPDSAGRQRDQPETKATSKYFIVSRGSGDQW